MINMTSKPPAQKEDASLYWKNGMCCLHGRQLDNVGCFSCRTLTPKQLHYSIQTYLTLNTPDFSKIPTSQLAAELAKRKEAVEEIAVGLGAYSSMGEVVIGKYAYRMQEAKQLLRRIAEKR